MSFRPSRQRKTLKDPLSLISTLLVILRTCSCDPINLPNTHAIPTVIPSHQHSNPNVDRHAASDAPSTCYFHKTSKLVNKWPLEITFAKIVSLDLYCWTKRLHEWPFAPRSNYIDMFGRLSRVVGDRDTTELASKLYWNYLMHS